MKRPSIVVIGAGLAGSLLCNELAADADVTLLELGERDRIRYPRIGFDRKALAHVPTFCYGGGGTTNLWHNGLIPIQQRDVLGEDFRDVLRDSERFMDAAASRLFFTGSFSKAYGAAVSEATAVAGRVGLVADGIDCLMYPRKHRRLTVDSRVNGIYGVEKLRFRFSDGRITRVDYASPSGESSVEPGVVIVAAGTMGSPRVLGDIIAAAGHRSDRLGAGFIDHPLGFVGKVRFRKEAVAAIKHLSMADRGDYVIRSAIRLKSACGRYTCCAFLRPAMTMHNSLAIYKYKSLLGATAGAARIRNAFSWRVFHPDIIAEIVSHLFGLNMPSRTFNVLFVAEQRPGSARVYYDGDDLRVDWSISDEELEIYRSLLRRLSTMLAGAAEEVNIETSITADWLWSGAHHSDTTPLGRATTDLVDRDLKLRYCNNVYVCDASVIQEHSYANTGLTIGQMALRLASQVRASLPDRSTVS